MRRLHFKLATVFGLALTFSLHPAMSIASYPTFESLGGISVIEGADGSGTIISLIKANNAESRTEIPCWEGINDPTCSGKVLRAGAFLLPCSEQNSIGCTVDVYAISKTGEKFPAKFIRPVGESALTDFPQSISKRLPQGTGVGGIWQIPGLNHGGGSDLYAVQNRLTGYKEGNLAGSAFYLNSAQFQISAFTTISGDFRTPLVDFSSGGAGFSGATTECLMTEKGICFKRASLPPEYRFGMKVRVPNTLSGWFHGRISKPEFLITNTNSTAAGTFEYQIEANPVRVPIMTKFIPQSSWSKDFSDYAREQWPMSHAGNILQPGNNGKLALELSRRFLPMIQDKATGSDDFWLIRTLDSFGDGKTDETVDPKTRECAADPLKVSGVVTTNAMVYSQGPPVYNEKEQSLDYKVLSPHFDEAGKENVGTYDLLIDGKVARCIYGFSNAPVKAQIEVVSDAGEIKVATTVLGERDPWIYLSANGFTFSQPTVRVRLSQDKPEPVKVEAPKVEAPQVETNSPEVVAAKPKLTAVKKKVITCTKGKLTKKISGANPKCPAGFKTKASLEPSSKPASTTTKRWIDEGDSCDPKITNPVKGYPKGMYITDWLKCDEQTRTYAVAKK
jgi:hypothetical protein